jgi:hypothetical protein
MPFHMAYLLDTKKPFSFEYSPKDLQRGMSMSRFPPAWLTRHRMDVTNTFSFFERQVPVLATNSSLVRNAACAVAAKYLGQLQDPRQRLSSAGQHAFAERLLSTGLDFLWCVLCSSGKHFWLTRLRYGAKYYDKCIHLLSAQISPGAFTPNFQPSPNEIYSANAAPLDPESDSEGRTSVLRLIGVTILCQYEHLNCMLRAWSGHLNGVDKFLRLFEEGTLYSQASAFEGPTRSVMEAVFWQFVLQDFEESCESTHFLCSTGSQSH